jgi:hypothetical protein
LFGRSFFHFPSRTTLLHAALGFDAVQSLFAQRHPAVYQFSGFISSNASDSHSLISAIIAGVSYFAPVFSKFSLSGGVSEV